jgi:hypothetical protein
LQSVNTLPDFIIESEQVINQGRSGQGSHLIYIFHGVFCSLLFILLLLEKWISDPATFS